MNTVRSGRHCAFFAVIFFLLFCQHAFAVDMQSSGFENLKARNFAKALESFSAALKEHPDSWMLMQSVGCCHMELGHYDTAIACLTKSMETGGLHASQCNNMAAIYQRMGQTQKAVSWLKLACSLDQNQAADPQTQTAMRLLEDPVNSPRGSPGAPDYLSSLVAHIKWSKVSMPLKVYVRKNIQIPLFYPEFTHMVTGALDQWCAAAGGALSYKLVSTAELADIICDYTDRRELVASDHELGIEGNTEMRVHAKDGAPGFANLTILVKDNPQAQTFRDSAVLQRTCLHELGHALGMHGHSPNPHDVMFSSAITGSAPMLSARDKATIRRIYR